MSGTPPTSPTPPNSPTPTPAVPAGPVMQKVRQLKRPFFELRIPDENISYLEGNYLRIIQQESGALGRFLAVARLDMDPKAKVRKVEYVVEDAKYPQLRPIDFLPLAEIEAFEKAAHEFYAKAHPDNKETMPAEKKLRASFRLPDPDDIGNGDAASYWIYGENFERKLLILWGCEWTQGSSLRLLKEDFIRQDGKPTVAEKLREKALSWGQMQRDALAMIEQKREPLVRFIGKPVRDAKGVLGGVKVLGNVIPLAKLRKLKFIMPNEMKAYDQAARQFYAKAHPEVDSSVYEKELRKGFRLPDHQKRADCFYGYGSFLNQKIIVVYDGDVPQEESICLVEDKQIDLPDKQPDAEAALFADAANKPAATLAEQFQRITIPVYKLAIAAALVLASPLLILLICWLFLDKKPPVIKDVVYPDAADQITVDFNKSVVVPDFASAAAPGSAVTAGTNAASGDTNAVSSHATSFSVEKGGSHPETITATVKSVKGSQVILKLSEPLEEGPKYVVDVNNVHDTTFLKNVIAPNTQQSFEYVDRLPPHIKAVSSDGARKDRLVVVFNKYVDKATAANVNNFGMSNYKFVGATPGDDANTVLLDAVPTYVNGQRYTLSAHDIQDASKSHNKMTVPEVFPFTFLDILPPGVRLVKSDQNQMEVDVQFTEALDPSSSTVLNNYQVRLKGGEELPVKKAALQDQSVVVLTLSKPVFPGRDYEAIVSNVKDLANNAITDPIITPFKYGGAEDKVPASISDLTINSPTEIVIKTDKPVRKSTILSAGKVSIVAAGGGGALPVRNAEPVDADPGSDLVQKIKFTLAQPVLERNPYTLTVQGVTDAVGNTGDLTSTIEQGGIFIRLKVENFEFNDSAKRILALSFNRDLNFESVSAKSFKIADPQAGGADVPVTSVRRGGDNRTVILNLGKPLQTGAFTGRFTDLKQAGRQRTEGDVFDFE